MNKEKLNGIGYTIGYIAAVLALSSILLMIPALVIKFLISMF